MVTRVGRIVIAAVGDRRRRARSATPPSRSTTPPQLRNESARGAAQQRAAARPRQRPVAGQGRRERPARLRDHRPSRSTSRPTARRSASIRRRWMRLERLVAGDPVQQRLMADVRRRVGAKLGELELDDRRCATARASTSPATSSRSAPAAPRWRRCARPPPRWPRTRRSAAGRARGRRRRGPTERRCLERGAGRAGGGRRADRPVDPARCALPARARDDAEATDRGARRAPARSRSRASATRVITTDARRPGRATSTAVAESLTGWAMPRRAGQAARRRCFRIVNESTRDAGREPGARARFATASIVGLANHTVLIRQRRLGDADRRQRGADPRRRRARCTAASSSFATSARGRPPSASSAKRRRALAARRHRHGDPDHGLRRRRRGPPRQPAPGPRSAATPPTS